MKNFTFAKAKSPDEAFKLYTENSRLIAGGTTLIDLMKLEVENPHHVTDINSLPFQSIEAGKGGGLRIGALVKNSTVAHDSRVEEQYPVLSQALLAGASAQIRNKASVSGNLLQRTRCVYFRDPSKPCNKREPKSGCSAMEGFHRNLAILGTSSSCIASNPSDMNVAMAALEASVQVQQGKSERTIPLAEFFLLPGDTPERETSLRAGEMITGVALEPLPPGTKSVYLKLRDRASYEFALSSAAVVMTLQGQTIQRVRMAMGGVGAIPWRSREAEALLEKGPANEEKFRQAAKVFVQGAKPQSQNAFKVDLAQRCLVQALKQVSQS